MFHAMAVELILTLGLPLEVGHLLCARQHLAVHAELTASARNQMRVLRSEVEDKDRVVKVVDLGGGHLD